MRISDWSSDVCSSDLLELLAPVADARQHAIAIGGRHQGVVELGPVRRCQARMPAGFAEGVVKLATIHHVLRHPAGVHRQDPDRSEEHTSELQSLMRISYAVFCLKQNK